MLRLRSSALYIVIGACLVLGGCASPKDDSTRTRTRTSTSPTPSPSDPGTGYVVADVRLIKTPDPVAQVIWSASFDAEWSGAGDPEPTRCRWQLLDEKKRSIAEGIVHIDESNHDDAQTPPIYPDEFAGVPRSARVTC